MNLIKIFLISFAFAWSTAAFGVLTNFNNGNQISISGQVVSTGPNSFKLDTGKRQITVEMDDWDWFKEGRQLMKNDSVIVYGTIDNDLLQRRTIEAGSVYVKNLNTYFYASSTDEEDVYYPRFALNPLTDVASETSMEIYGRVVGINGRLFTLDTGEITITVDTSAMTSNPMDNEGYQQIRKGDKVYVAGTVSEETFTTKKIKARTVITLKSERRVGPSVATKGKK